MVASQNKRYKYTKTKIFHLWTCIKKGISDAGIPQADRDLDAETLLIKLQLDACNS